MNDLTEVAVAIASVPIVRAALACFSIFAFLIGLISEARSQRTRRGAVNTSVVTMLTECLAGTGIAQIFAVVARDLLKNKLVELI